VLDSTDQKQAFEKRGRKTHEILTAAETVAEQIVEAFKSGNISQGAGTDIC